MAATSSTPSTASRPAPATIQVTRVDKPTIGSNSTDVASAPVDLDLEAGSDDEAAARHFGFGEFQTVTYDKHRKSNKHNPDVPGVSINPNNKNNAAEAASDCGRHPGERKSYKKQEVNVGSRRLQAQADGATLRSVPRESFVHVYRMDPDTTEIMVKKYVKDVVEIDVIGCEKLSTRNSRIYSSFKLTVKRCDETAVLDPNHWPEGIHIKKFFQRKAPLSQGN